MYSIDFVDNGNGTIRFTHDYMALIEAMNLRVDAGILDSNIIDEDEFIYDESLIRNREYEAFVYELNNAICNTEMTIDSGIDGNVYLFVNGAMRGSIDHISDEDIDMLFVTHIPQYYGMSIDESDSVNNINIIGSMIKRFVNVVQIMNDYDSSSSEW